MKYLNSLKDTGVTNLKNYLDEYPELIVNLENKIKLIDVNKGTLKLYHAKSKDEFFENLPDLFTPTSLKTFKEQLSSFRSGNTTFESESNNRKLDGDILSLHFKASIAIESMNTWDSVLVSIQDLTEKKMLEQSKA